MELTIQQALQQAVAAHNKGNLQQAERIYQAILQSQPKHPDANHNLGLIAIALGRPETALELFHKALDVNPKIEQFWLSYVDALIKNNQIKDAKRAIKRAKKIGFDSQKLEALYLPPKLPVAGKTPPQVELDSLLKYYQAGRYGDAEKQALSLTHKFPTHQFGWKVLGTIFEVDAVDSVQTGVKNIEGLIRFFELANEESFIDVKEGESFVFDGSGFTETTPKPQIFYFSPPLLPYHTVREVVDYLNKITDGQTVAVGENFDWQRELQVSLESNNLEELIRAIKKKASITLVNKGCSECYEIHRFRVR